MDGGWFVGRGDFIRGTNMIYISHIVVCSWGLIMGDVGKMFKSSDGRGLVGVVDKNPHTGW